MPHPTSVPPDGIVLDTNVLSLLAAAGQLDLLQQLAACPLYITPKIVEELHTGISKGIQSLNDALTLIHIGQLRVLQLTVAEKAQLPNFPTKLGQGEVEAITVCRRRNMIFITRDRKAANYCDCEGIGCIRLKELLMEFLQIGLLTKPELDAILA